MVILWLFAVDFRFNSLGSSRKAVRYGVGLIFDSEMVISVSRKLRWERLNDLLVT